MTEQVFFDYGEFWKMVGEKRCVNTSMNDINMINFNAMLFDSLADEYICKVRLKEEFHKNYKSRTNLVMMENTHLIHWAEWLDIGVIIKKHPALAEKKMLVTRVEIVLHEPCYIDQTILYKIKMLKEKIKREKSEFTFLNRIHDWIFITVNFVLMEQEMEVLEHYYQKHGKT